MILCATMCYVLGSKKIPVSSRGKELLVYFDKLPRSQINKTKLSWEISFTYVHECLLSCLIYKLWLMATLHYLPIRMSFKLSRVTLHERFTNDVKTSRTTLQQI